MLDAICSVLLCKMKEQGAGCRVRMSKPERSLLLVPGAKSLELEAHPPLGYLYPNVPGVMLLVDTTILDTHLCEKRLATWSS